MKISRTAEQHGFGSMPWKWVSRMTDEERQACRNGEPVFFLSSRLSGGRHGTFWRKALWSGRHYIPRTVTQDELTELVNFVWTLKPSQRGRVQ